ncbi:MAG: CHRD domain-containing protein [Actinobacteria bacterium]|nr:CHRD domain-containing protein [Actinomycetota bacterium]
MKKWFIKVLPLSMMLFFLIVFISPSLVFGDSVKMDDYSKTPSGFVMMYYNSILNREAASSEVDEWVMRLNQGTATGYSLVWNAVLGEENKQMVSSASNEDFVKWLYMVILMREPDTAGLNAWVMSGLSKEGVLDGFLKSDEFVMISKNFGVYPFSSSETKGQAFSAILTGANEVPSVQTEAMGSAVFMLSSDGKSLWYKITVYNIIDPQASHIHWAMAGVNGPVVVALFPTGTYTVKSGEFSGVLAEGTIMAKNLKDALAGKTIMDLVAGIKAGNTYVNVHTLAHPAGEIRGQIK